MDEYLIAVSNNEVKAGQAPAAPAAPAAALKWSGKTWASFVLPAAAALLLLGLFFMPIYTDTLLGESRTHTYGIGMTIFSLIVLIALVVVVVSGVLAIRNRTRTSRLVAGIAGVVAVVVFTYDMGSLLLYVMDDRDVTPEMGLTLIALLVIAVLVTAVATLLPRRGIDL